MGAALDSHPAIESEVDLRFPTGQPMARDVASVSLASSEERIDPVGSQRYALLCWN
jgi:hypothetical protein